MNYRQAVEYLNNETTEGIEPDLSRITLICRLLGNPQHRFPVIHITGTNGKTSTARMINGILSASGVRTGTYTSPHLISYTERYLIDGRPIAEDTFAGYVRDLVPRIEKVNEKCEGRVTQFEALTAIAFLHFASERVDCAVVEVGMGGGWDATSVVRPDVAVITNVALEHTDRLGTTVEAIAAEKAGVIKKGCSVVTSATQPAVQDVLTKRSAGVGAPVFLLGRDFQVRTHADASNSRQDIDISGVVHKYQDVRLTLVGGYQATNAADAVVAAELFLKRRRPDMLASLPQAVRRSLAAVRSPGRLEIISRRPVLVLDGAHNPAGAEELAGALKANFKYDRLVLVLAVLADKDVDGIVAALAPLADQIISTQALADRAMSAADLAVIIRRHAGAPVLESGSVAEAITHARDMAGPEDLILITGSLYTVGESKTALRSHVP